MIQRSFLLGLSVLLQALNIQAEGSCDTPGKDNIIRLTGSNGSITLPKPSNNRSCTWIITVPERNVVKLMISSYHLKNSTLQYGDGQNSSSEVLETFSGEDTEKTVLSSGRHLWARFQSIQDEQAEFFARYEAFAESRNGSVVEIKETKARKVSSGHLANDSPRGMNCTWLIIAPERHFVILKMKELELDGNCDNSAFHVRHGKNPFISLLKKFCGQKGESSMFSSGHYLYVQVSFKSDAPGFDAVEKVPAPFSCSANSHRSILYESSENLASYIFPLPDDEPTKCVWRFKISSECKLSFDSFNLSDSKNCAYDYVKIHRARYCGTNGPPTVTSEGSEISITYKFNGKTRYPGFKRSTTSKPTKGDILKIAGVTLGAFTMFSVCTFTCYTCIKSDDEEEDIFETMVTECDRNPSEEETVIKLGNKSV